MSDQNESNSVRDQIRDGNFPTCVGDPTHFGSGHDIMHGLTPTMLTHAGSPGLASNEQAEDKTSAPPKKSKSRDTHKRDTKRRHPVWCRH